MLQWVVETSLFFNSLFEHGQRNEGTESFLKYCFLKKKVVEGISELGYS